MNWQFQYKELFLLFFSAALLLLLFTGLLRWKSATRRKIGDPELVSLLIRNFSHRRFALKFILVILALSAGILAVMNPRTPGDSGNKTRKGIDIAIALDVSKSMLAADLAPNRLERAKQLINKFMAEMPDDRVALVLFAGKAYLQMPLTGDHGAVDLFVSSVSPDAVPQQGTVISEALTMSAGVFNSADKRFRSVLLISDGEDHDADAAQTARALAKKGVMINTIGIGSPEGAPIGDPATGENKKDEAGNTVISKLNEEGLKEIARETNGRYIRLQNSDEAIAALKDQLAQIERKAYGDISQMNFKTYYGWLAAAMFILLLAEIFIPETKKRMAV
ncbi:MAG: VWA domain-containing protein [Sphingobacteriales bacterium]|nr:VWA domain-containing protein [Sphingobacteriales bacterium]